MITVGQRTDDPFAGPKYLFCVGGISKKEATLNIISNIYRLDLQKCATGEGVWEEVPVTLSSPLCDIGLTFVKNKETKKDEILIFGGWNYVSYDKVQLMTNDEDVNQITITNVE